MYLILIVIFIVATANFGLFNRVEGISFQTSFGTFEVGQILILVSFALLIAHKLTSKGEKVYGNKILTAMLILFLFMLFQGVRNLSTGTELQLVLRGLKRIYMFLFFIPLIMLIKDRNELEKYLKLILLIGFISSLVAIYQFISGSTIGVSEARDYEGGFKRIYHPGAFLMAFCFFVLLSRYLAEGFTRKNIINYIYIPFYLLGLLTTLHRSLIGATILVSVLIVLLFFVLEKKIKSSFKLLILIAVVMSAMYYFVEQTGFGIEGVLGRMDTAISDIKYNQGNYSFRFLIMYNTFTTIIKENALFGLGFNFSDSMDPFDPYSLSWDTDYANIIIIFGVVGFILLVYIFYIIISTSIKNYKQTIYPSDKTFYLVFITFPVFFLMTAIFSQFIIFSPNLTILVNVFGILYLLDKFSDKNLDTNNA